MKFTNIPRSGCQSGSHPADRGVNSTPLAISKTKQADEVLIVIDMQSFFPASLNEFTLLEVEREICESIELGRPIIFVEYDPADCGRTHDRLLSLVENYPNHFFVSKAESDGSKEILEACIQNNICFAHPRFCGVNSDACILETVIGISEKLRKLVCLWTIQVVKSACNCLTGDSNDVWIEDFPALENLEVV